ncbi:hypothetical protein ABZ635_05130 [Nocardiopsis sp. NPDC007018]|uniref:hypothetical protein n=1 Tax=Nocardiopsis sp. NPDC007018 TaxID=3155721 RepID=UPI0033FCCC60
MPRLLIPLATLTLAASACGPGEGRPPTDQPSEGVVDEEGTDLTAPGILTAACGSGEVTLTLLSDEDGTELSARTFDTDSVTGGESEHFPFGHAVLPQEGSVRGVDCENADPFLNDRELLFVSFVEELDGTEVNGFGVVDEAGTLTALSPPRDTGDFTVLSDYTRPHLDRERNRIVFVEQEGDEGDGTVHALDLGSGETTPIGECETHCHTITLPPGAESPLFGLATHRIVVDPGSGLAAASHGAYEPSVFLFDPGSESTDGFPEFSYGTGEPTNVMGEVAHMFEGPSLLVENDELTVVEFTAEDLTADGAVGDDLGSRTLVPPSERTNTSPQPSPDGTEIVFLSETESGEASWYRVPFDGSTEPERISDVPAEHLGSTIVAWQ